MERPLAVTVSLLLTLAAAQVKNPGTLVSLTTTDWTSFDPAQCYDTACQEVLQNTLETLYLPSQAPIGSAGRAQLTDLPLLANALPTLSNSGRTYTVHLRPSARFSDGTPVTSADVKYSLMRAMLMSTEGGASALLLEPFLGSTVPLSRTDAGAFGRLDAAIQTPTPTTVVFHLARPFSPFVSVLAHPVTAVLSKAAATRAGAWDGGRNTWQKYSDQPLGDSPFLSVTPLGSGPFLLSRYEKGQQVVLRRNDRYWRTPAGLSTVVIRKVEEPSVAVQLLKTGDADQTQVNGYPRNVQAQFRASRGVMVIDGIPTLSLDALFMNFNIQDRTKLGSGTLSEQGIPATFFSDRHVRLGFAHSLDTVGFVRQQLLGQGTVNNTVVSAPLPGYDAGLRYTFDRAAAASEFRQAWNGHLWQTGFTVSIFWDSGNPNRQAAAQMLKTNIEALNPRFHIEVQEAQFSQILADAAARRASVWLASWQADYADPHNFVQPLLASHGLTGLRTGYSNRTIDTLIDQAVAEGAAVKRGALYQQIVRLAFRDVPEIPLYQTVAYTAQREWVKGRTYSPLNGGDYYYTTSK